MTFFMSVGARNCPFLMLTGLPDWATARMKSVWRHRKAGVCSTSTTLATGATCDSSCTSVRMGRCNWRRTCPGSSGPRPARAALAGARGAVGLVERALEDEEGMPSAVHFL